MAGIGFNLQKILKGDTYIDVIKAYFYSALIAAGPWIMSIATLFVISFINPKSIDIFELTYFRTTIIYIYAFSLIVVGLIQIAMTRYLADKLYLKEKDALAPIFNTAAILVLASQTIIGAVLFSFTDSAINIKILSIMIYLTISLIWLVMIFLTALWDYRSILFAYGAGCIAAIIACWLLGKLWGLTGFFTGYLLGHLIIVALLSARIFTEFGSTRVFDSGIIQFAKENKTLLLIGITYNLAIWIDKIVFWFSPDALHVSGILKTYPIYESAVFFAYLTIIPALSFFLLEAETNFYQRYQSFYQEILNRGSYSAIEKRKKQIESTLAKSMGFIVKYQGLISLIFITFAPQITDLLKTPWLKVPVFRIAVLGSFLHSLLLVTIIIVLYFDFQKLALGICTLFLITNGLFAFFTSRMPIEYLGFGYFAATLFSLIFGFYALNYKLRRLEYLTFAPQPIGIHREEEIW